MTKSTKTPARSTAKVVQSMPLPVDSTLLEVAALDAKSVRTLDPSDVVAWLKGDAKKETGEKVVRSYVRALTLPVVLDTGVKASEYAATVGLPKSYVSDLGLLAVAVRLGFGISTPAKLAEWKRLAQGKNVPQVRAALRDDKPTAKAVRAALVAFTNSDGTKKAAISETSTRTPNAAAPEGPTPTGAEVALEAAKTADKETADRVRIDDATKVVRPSVAEVEAFLSALATKPSSLPKGKRADFALLLEAALEAVNGLSTK